jgi:hypothetical protein
MAQRKGYPARLTENCQLHGGRRPALTPRAALVMQGEASGARARGGAPQRKRIAWRCCQRVDAGVACLIHASPQPARADKPPAKAYTCA